MLFVLLLVMESHQPSKDVGQAGQPAEQLRHSHDIWRQ